MAGSRAAIRYAKALISLATDQKAADAVNGDMKLIANTIANSKELCEALQGADAKGTNRDHQGSSHSDGGAFVR